MEPYRLAFNGWAFYQSLKADPNLANIPAIIYTVRAYSGSPNPVDYGDTLFIRPLDFDDLIEKVEELSGGGKGGE